MALYQFHPVHPVIHSRHRRIHPGGFVKEVRIEYIIQYLAENGKWYTSSAFDYYTEDLEVAGSTPAAGKNFFHF